MPSGPIDPNATVDAAQESPLSAAVSQRDQDTLEMVRMAIERRDALLAFQPVVQSVENGQVAFYEGLIRVLDQNGRVIPARDFMDAVETSEMGRVLDCLALEMGLIALGEEPGLRLALNLSARSIGYPRWVKTLNEGIARDKTIAERLILEITESSAMVMPDIVTVFMRDLQARGIAFALDDFGAGYTAIRYLREFYFDILKIDGQFIRGIADNPDNQVLTSAMIAIARHFDMFTVAENVETARDAAWLAAAGVDCMQGYAFGAPSLVPPWREDREQRRA